MKDWYKILEIIEKHNNLTLHHVKMPIGKKASEANMLLHKELVNSKLINENEKIYLTIFSNFYELLLGEHRPPHRFQEKVHLAILKNEYKNYKRTKLIDDILE